MSRAFRLGLFIVATLLIFAGGVYWIGNKQFLFTSTYRLNADFQTVAGLSGGAEVRVGGIHEGTVRQIQLPQKSNEKVRLVMDMQRATREVIKRDSIATIRSEGLVGDKFVERSEEHTSELQSLRHLVCRLLLEKKKKEDIQT